MTALNKQALRERYSEKPAPKCHICGAVMTIQRAGSGGVVYGCTGRIDRDGEGYKFEAGRDFADDHYARSRVTDYSPSGDPDVLALLDELEAAEGRIAEQIAIVAAAEKLVRCKGRYHSELNYRSLAKLFGVTTPDLPPLEHENVHYADAAEMEIAALRQRINELESRTVIMPPKEHDNGTDSQIDINAGFANRMWQKCYDAIRAAGIGVKGE
ncbi:TPA: ead/Ea22-like family protein [Citrobacter braakii]